MNYICIFSLLIAALPIAACSNKNMPETTTPELGSASTPLEVQANCDAPENDIKAAMLYLINDARASARNCGAISYPATTALTWNTTLELAAANHNADMAQHNFFNHTGSDGLEPSDRVTATGYIWANVGENLAGGQPTARTAVEAWIDSPGHCANLMNQNFQELGVSCESSATNSLSTYWTAVFGTQR